jgi:hypothetical protein
MRRRNAFQCYVCSGEFSYSLCIWFLEQIDADLCCIMLALGINGRKSWTDRSRILTDRYTDPLVHHFSAAATVAISPVLDL